MISLSLINLLEIDFEVDNHIVHLVGYLVLSMVIYLSTTWMVTFAMHLSIGVPIKRTWNEQFSWLAPYYLVLGMISYALSFSYIHAGFIGALVITVPLMLLYFSQKQYIDRTKEIVKELKEKNIILKNNSDEITTLNEGLLKMLAEVVDLRDPFVLGHSQQVTRYSVMIATKLGLDSDAIERIRQAGLLHDIGKLGIPERILLKPSKLTPEEYQIVKEHANLGAELLRASSSLQTLIPIIRHHHERFDGNGYPDGLVGENIPMEARIVSVADAIEAMASDRPYREAMGLDKILEELDRNRGNQFDPQIVIAFKEIAQEERATLVINSAREGVNSRLRLNLDDIYHELWQGRSPIPKTSGHPAYERNNQQGTPAYPPLKFVFTHLPSSSG
jgi:putative nucleotidyltransferase with HDIG domain